MFKNILRFLNGSDNKERIATLEYNQKILQNYIVVTNRLLFFPPENLDREANNLTANNEYITRLYELKNTQKQEKEK
jgi:hypothetical protein